MIDFSDLIGFGNALSDTQDGLRCWRHGKQPLLGSQGTSCSLHSLFSFTFVVNVSLAICCHIGWGMSYLCQVSEDALVLFGVITVKACKITLFY